jgi:hypothetical protein
MSYEMLMQLVLTYLKERKDFRLSKLEVSEKHSLNNNNNNNREEFEDIEK